MDSVTALRNINSVCRLCLRTTHALKHIILCDSPTLCDKKSLRDKIFDCTSVEISALDGLPPNICDECHKKVDTMYNFRMQCLSSDSTLRNHFMPGACINVEVEGMLADSDLCVNLGDIVCPDFDNNCSERDTVGVSECHAVAAVQSASRKLEYSQEPTEHCPKYSKAKLKEVEQKTALSCPNKCHENASSNSQNVSIVSVYNISHESRLCNKKWKRGPIKAKYVCQECGKGFKHKYSFTRHRLLHKGDPFKCKYCRKFYWSRQSCKRHEKTHSGEKPYKCKICDKSYVSSTSYSAHVRKHTGERPYNCSQCSESFYLLSSFDRHVAKHMGVKKYICEICSASFWVADDLRAHVNRVH